ncbi:MAG: hypothetical protein P4L84_35030 [Isosphaeraceae bacterium]|nr:hypothetical protein [Isosphaeraceae bacterium]
MIGIPAPRPASPEYDALNKSAGTLPAGTPVCVDATGIGVQPAGALGTANPAVGLLRQSCAPAAVATIVTFGNFKLADWTAVTGTTTLAARATYYLSETPGQLTTTPPSAAGDTLQIMGVAVDPYTLDLDPSVPILMSGGIGGGTGGGTFTVDATALQGYPITTTVPTAGNVLTFQSGEWVPAAPTAGGGDLMIGGSITGATSGDLLFVGSGSVLAQAAITGLIKWSDTGPEAAVAGTDYLAPGGSGAALTGITVSQVEGAAPLASPVLTGTPTAPTATVGTNTAQIATCAFVLANTYAGAVSSVFGRTGAIGASTGDYSVGQITGAAPLASPSFTGTPVGPTPSTADNSTKLATTAYVQAQGYTTAAAVASYVASQGFLTSAPVTSVAGRTGAITLAVADVSGAAPLASPAFTSSITVGNGLTNQLAALIYSSGNCIITTYSQFYFGTNQGSGPTYYGFMSSAGNWSFGSSSAPLGTVSVFTTANATKGLVIQAHSASQSAPLAALQGISSTSTARDVGYLDAGFSTTTDASYKGFVRLCAQDYNATSGGREGLRVGTDGTQALLGLFGSPAVAKPNVTGSKGGNTALASLLTALANLGLITDSST